MGTLMKPQGGLVLAQGAQDYSEDAGRGMKGVDSSHFSPPFLNVAQDLSKLVKSREANVGDFFISSTKEVFDGKKGVTLVVCGTHRYYAEWRPNNGGFVGRHEVSSEVVANARAKSPDKFKLTNGLNNLMETFDVYGLLIREDGSFAEVVMPFASTKIKVYKKDLVPRVFGVGIRDDKGNPTGQVYPSYAHALKIATKTEIKNNNEFSNVLVDYVGGRADNSRLDRSSELYKRAADFAALVESGQVKAEGNSSGGDEVPF